MNQRTLKKLEFDKIREMLMGCCSCSLGKELAEKLEPSLEPGQVSRLQSETTEGREMLRLHPDLPFGGISDVRLTLKRARIGGILEPAELLALGETLYGGRRVRQFILDTKEPFPIVKNLAGGVGVFRKLEDQIIRCILPGGEVADAASDELLKLRKQKRVLNTRIKEKLEQVVKGSQWQKMLQEGIVTQRGDRYVVPVKQEYRGQFPGIIHDQSASGATLYIEPMAVVEANNDLRRVFLAEKEEIIKILADLSDQVREQLEELEISVECLAELDFIFAKARLSQRMNAWEPAFNTRGYMNILKGRHPLITGKVVPVSINLGGEFSTLIITGPNTGGKTVTLKMLGLFVLMTQAGLHIPAEHGSEMGYYTQIFTDIGDEQSIEQSLSTFSSHMTNLVDILTYADSHTLVLADELGAGTDPSEGAALAMAILEELKSRGTKTITTTHYSELKNYAFTNPEIENASVEFDVATLQPTYRLLIGQPGSSNAFEIALRLGLDSKVVERARGFQSEEERETAKLLRNLEETQKLAEAERQEAQTIRLESERMREEYSSLQAKMEAKREHLITKAREEAYEIVKKSRQEAEDIITQLKADLAKETAQDRLNLGHKARHKLRGLASEHSSALADRAPSPGQPPRSVKPGQAVLIPHLNQRGVVLEPASSNGEVMVQVGIMKITVPLSDLRQVAEEKFKLEGGQERGTGRAVEGRRSGSGKLMSEKAQTVTREVDLRGLTVDEALDQMDKYLDNALLAGVGQVFIIHGKGTGALRAAIKTALAKHPSVKSYRLGVYGEGGDGVTVVEF